MFMMMIVAVGVAGHPRLDLLDDLAGELAERHGRHGLGVAGDDRLAGAQVLKKCGMRAQVTCESCSSSMTSP